MAYSEALTTLLSESGWFLGREVDWKSDAESEMPGVRVPVAAQAVLKELSGLVVTGENGMQVFFGADYGGQAADLIAPFSEILKLPVYPVASTNEGDPTIFVDAKGRFYYQWVGIMYIGATLVHRIISLRHYLELGKLELVQ